VECECLYNYYYWPRDGRCYRLYTRGPCKPDEVLVMEEVTINKPLLFNENGNDGKEMTVTTRWQLTCKKSFCGGEDLAYSEKHGYCFMLGMYVEKKSNSTTIYKIYNIITGRVIAIYHSLSFKICDLL
jgi:hypothetical protein